MLAALALVTCAEDPIGPATGQGHLRIIPVFGPYARIAPLTLDQVRIVVERQDSRTETSDTVVDEVRAFDVNRDQLRIDDLTVRMQVASEDLLVTLQLLSNSTLLFQGSQIVRVVRGQSTPQTSIPVSYLGPGANVASLTLAPRDTVLSAGATLDYRLDAFDIQGATVAQYYVSWSLTGGPATGAGINAVGRLTTPAVPDTFFVKVVAPNGVMDSTRAIVGTATAPPAFTWTGAVSTDWSVAGNWSPAQVPGFLDSVVIGAAGRQPSLSTTTVTGAVNIIAGGNLTINGQGLSIVRGLTTGGTGVLTMTNDADVVAVGGNARFDGGNELNLLSAGGLSIAGNLTQAASTSGDSYHPSGTHLTVLAGTAQTVSFATPGLVPGTSHFQDVAWVGTGTLTLLTPVMAHGTFVVSAAAASTIATPNGSRLTVGDFASVAPVIFNGVPLTLSQSTPGSLTLSNVTFQSMATNVSQLVVSHPGTGGGAFDFSNLVFSTTPVAPNGFYIDVTDNTGPTDGTLTINLVNPAPISGGAFIKTTNGAIVNWPSSAARTWTGAVSTDWSVAGNWSPAQVPTNTDDVIIPSGTPNGPTITASCSAQALTVNIGASLNLGAFNCQVGGNVFADGTIVGSGAVQIATTAQIRGRFPGLILSGPITATGTLVVTGSLTLTGVTADLVLGGNRANITGNLTTQSGAVFTMTSPLDTVQLLGNANFGGGSTTGRLTQGVLSVGASFTQSGAATSFAPSGSHRVNINGVTTHTITFSDPANSRFQNLDVGANAASIALATNVTVLGQLISKPTGISPPVVTTAGTSTLTAGGADITLLTIDKVPLTLSGGTIGAFSNVIFQNQPSTATQLRVTNTGQAAPFVFDKLTFLTLPTGGGLYLVANDLDGATPNPLVINLTNASPATGGALFQATNGAVVNWPVGAVRTWTGVVNTDWSTAGNWNPAQVPTGTDDVVIPATTNAPTASNTCAAKTLTVNAGATLNLAAITCQVGGNVFADGAINGGTVQITAAASVRGTIATLAVAGAVTVTGNMALSNNLTISSGDLTLNGHSVTVGNLLATQGSGTLTMTNAADQLTVVNLADFSGGSTTGKLTAGQLILQGNFNQGGATTSFAPSGSHLTTLASSLGNVTFTNPGSSFFQNLTITGNSQRLISDLQVKGMLTATQTTLQAPTPPHTVTVGGVNVNRIGLSGLAFVIQGGPIVQFDTVLFSNSPTTTAQLTVNHPGAATPFTFHGIQFATTPVAPNGFYLAATDLVPGDGLPLVINMREPQPLTPSGFVAAAGGATVPWPQALTLTWTGGTSQFFGTATNWSPANFPTSVDDVIIPATATQPVTSGGVFLHNLTLQSGAILTLQGQFLSVGGDLVNDGTINGGTQGVVLTGGGNVVRGNGVLQTPTVITGHYTMTGNLSLRPTNGGALALSGTAQLSLNGHTLNDSTPFALSNSATVVMTNPLDSLILGGFPALFDGGDETNRLTSGVLVLTQASLVQANTNGAGNSFVSLGNHKVAVRGSSGSITLATPASAPISQFECGSTGGVGCTFGSNVTVTGNVVVPGSGLLVPSGRTLTIGVGLTTTGTGRLAMLNANDSILVGANANFAGGPTQGLLTQGVLVVKGDFTQSAVTSTTSYSPSGTHKTVLGDAVARAISMGSPGALTAGSHFQVLDVSNATGGLSLDVNMQADSLISNSAAAKLTSAGVALTVRRAQVSGLILDQTRFILDEQGTFMTENFSNVTFTGFPIPTTNTTMLTVMGPGGAAAARPVVKTDGVTFQSMATNSGNFYVSLTSTNGFPFGMTMNGSNQRPAVGGNGPTLTELIPPTGAATVNWP